MYFIGVDVSKDKVDVCVISDDKKILKEKIIKNRVSRLMGFLNSIEQEIKRDKVLVCCENTGIYGVPLERACELAGVDLWVENAWKIKRASTDFRGKTDRKDAHRIACYAARYADLKRVHQPASEWNRQLRTLLNAREDLISQRQGLRARLSEAKSHDPDRYGILFSTFAPVIHALDNQIKHIDQRIEQLKDSNQEIKKNLQLLTSIPGIGLQNALQFIIHTDNMKRFATAKHLACYAGVAPFPNQSGNTSKPDRVSKHANQTLKRLLHMAAMAAIRSKSDLRAFYIRKVAQGKNKMAVLNAVRNKLVHRMFAVIKRQEPYMIDQQKFLSNAENACIIT